MVVSKDDVRKVFERHLEAEGCAEAAALMTAASLGQHVETVREVLGEPAAGAAQEGVHHG